jgi:hypothetical protein
LTTNFAAAVTEISFAGGVRARPRAAKISKTTPCKVAGGGGGLDIEGASFLTCRANQRQYFIIPSMELPVALADN